ARLLHGKVGTSPHEYIGGAALAKAGAASGSILRPMKTESVGRSCTLAQLRPQSHTRDSGASRGNKLHRAAVILRLRRPALTYRCKPPSPSVSSRTPPRGPHSRRCIAGKSGTSRGRGYQAP